MTRRSFRRNAVDNKEADMVGFEEVGAYSDLFSTLEWLALTTDDWSLLDEDEEGSA